MGRNDEMEHANGREEWLVRMAASVSDGDEIDWEEALRAAPNPTARHLVRPLRVLDGIARALRSLRISSQAAEGDADGTGPPATAVPAPSPQPPSADETIATEPETTAPTLRHWGKLQIRAALGGGRFGEVFRAWDPSLEREVALKLLLPERDLLLAASGDASAVLEEGRLLARVESENVVKVFGAERLEGRVGLWMELIRGRTLERQLHEQGPSGAHEATLVGLGLCRALTAVHRAGLVHRDVKAHNVMRGEGGRIVLMDFGTGTRLVADPRRSSIAGTPLYMAPEVLRGEPATPQSDIYSLGVLLYHLVTGSYPVEATDLAGLASAHERGQVTLLREARPDLPEPFVRVIERALALDPPSRFASAGQMEQALAAALGIEPVPVGGTSPGMTDDDSPWPGWIRVGAFAAAACVVLGVGLVVLRGIEQRREPSRVTAPLAGSPANPSATGLPPTTQPAGPEAGSPARTGDGGTYTVQATFLRRHAGTRERIAPGARLAKGDGLALDFEASEPLYLYVVDEDERGEAYLLFPLPGVEPSNPLPPNLRHELPGRRQGKSLDWIVSSAGGREHLLVVASRERLTEFEADMLALPHAGSDAEPRYAQLSERSKTRLRGIGGLEERPPETADASTTRRLFDYAARLAAGSEVVHGAWVRQIEFENPGE